MRPLLIISKLFLLFQLHGQISVLPNRTAIQMAQKLVGNDQISITSATLNCPGNALGFFNSTNTVIPIDSGIVLTNGLSNQIPGISTINRSSTIRASNTPDPDITSIGATSQLDLCALEFSFIPKGDSIFFDYVFASEEYPNFNCSQINDIFGLFLSGPGIIGKKNIATVPGTNIPISINSINNGVVSPPNSLTTCNNMGAGSPFTQYYISNSIGIHLAYNGLTTLLTAKHAVQPFQTYTLKLAIVDVFDAFFDSGIFFKSGSFISNPLLKAIAKSSGDTITNPLFLGEGCQNGSINFSLSKAATKDISIKLNYKGNANNLIDIASLPDSITIKKDSVSLKLNLSAIEDNIRELNDSLMIIAENNELFYKDTFIFRILDRKVSIFNATNDTSICEYNSVNLYNDSISNLYSFKWTPNTYLSNSNIANPRFLKNDQTSNNNLIYNVSVKLPKCNAIDSNISIFVKKAPRALLNDTIKICSNVVTSIIGNVISDDSYSSIWSGISHTKINDTTISFNSNSNFFIKFSTSNSIGCKTEDSAFVKVNDIKNDFLQINQTNSSCVQNGTLKIKMNPLNGPFLYKINNNPFSTNDSFFGLASNFYLLKIKNNIGCELDTNVKINQDTFKLLYNKLDATCGQLNGSIITMPQSFKAPLQFQWNTGQVLQNLINIDSGFYKLVGTDANGCRDSFSVRIINSSKPVIKLNALPINCHRKLGSIITEINGGTSPFSWQWSNSGSTNNLLNLNQGKYTATLTDSKGCIAIDSAIVRNDSIPVLNFTKFDNRCEKINSQIVLKTNFGLKPYTYSWNNGDSRDSVNNLLNGTYQIIVTDSSLCKDTQVIEIFEKPITKANFNLKPSTCRNANGEINLTIIDGQAPFDISWSNGILQNLSLKNLNQGSYWVKIKDADLCEDTFFTFLGNISDPKITFEKTLTSCQLKNGSITANVSNSVGNIIYEWSNLKNQKTITNIDTGTYSLTIIDSLGCIKTATTQLSSFPEIIFTSSIKPNTCEAINSKIEINTISGNPPYNFSWSNGSNSEDIQNIVDGKYFITITDSKNCQKMDTFDIVSIKNVKASFIKTTDYCNLSNGSIQTNLIGGTAPFQFNWSNGSVSKDLNNILKGIYTVTIIDVNQCVTIFKDTIFEEKNQISYSINKTNLSCFEDNSGSIKVNANSNYLPLRFSLNLNVWNTIDSFSDLSKGTYNIGIKDSRNCIITETVFIEQPNKLLAEIIKKDIECTNRATGMARVIGIGGTKPYQYKWSNNIIDSFINQVVTGKYKYEIKDFNNCLYQDSLYINQPDTYQLNTQYFTPKCFGDASGKIVVQPKGGNPSYQYRWFYKNVKDSILDQIQSGNYNLELTDSKLCKDTFLFDLKDLPEYKINALDIIEPSCYNKLNGQIDVYVDGGNGAPFSYQLNNTPIQPFFRFKDIDSGIYTLRIWDSNNCLLDTIIKLKKPEKPNYILEANPKKIILGTSSLVNFEPLNFEVNNINWKPEIIMSCNQCSVSEAYPNKSSYIIIQIIDKKQCIINDSLWIDVEDDYNLGIANVFSPFAENTKNQELKVQGNHIKKASLTIYNRIGEVIFDTNQGHIRGWDGYYKGKLAEPGIYQYHVKTYHLNNQIKEKKGNFTLLY
jgi:gliding motility-associated-like protein